MRRKIAVFLLFLLALTLVWPTVALGASQTVSTNSKLYLSTTSHNSSTTSREWTSPLGGYILRARFKGNSESGYDWGYLYAWNGSSWTQVARQSGSYDVWVTLPAGTTKIYTKLTTDYSVLLYPTYVDVPEAEVEVPPPYIPGKPTLGGGSPSTYNVRISWNVNGNPSGTQYELWRKTLNADGTVAKDEKIYTGSTAEFTTTDQTAGKYYLYRVRATYNSKTSDFSSETSYWTAPMPSVQSAGTCSVTLNVPKVMNGLTYTVLYRPQGASTPSTVNTTSLAPTISGLNPNLRYEFGLAPVLSEGGNAWWTGWVTGTPLAAQPGTPGFDSKGQTSFGISWANNGNGSGTPYEVWWHPTSPLKSDGSFGALVNSHNGNSSNSNSVSTPLGGGWTGATHYNTAKITIGQEGSNKFLRFISDGSGAWAGVTGGWSIKAGKWYRVTAYARTSSSAGLNISAYAIYTGNFNPQLTWSNLKSADGWKMAQVVFQADADRSGSMYLYGNQGTAGTTVDYDNIVVEEFDSNPGSASVSFTGGCLTTTATSATITSLTPGTSYDVMVQAHNIDNKPSSFSSATCRTVPATPTTLNGSSGGLGWSNSAGRGWVALSWNPVPGATGYRVWVFDGNTYCPIDVGNVLSWDSRQAKIYPPESELDAFADNSIGGGSGTIPLGTSLQLALTNYQSGTKEWTSSSEITQVHFKGTLWYSRDQAYLEYLNGSTWIIAKGCGYGYGDFNWDTWVNIPAGVSKIRIRLSTGYDSANRARTIQVPEVKVSYQPFRTDKSGLDLRDDPNKLYKKTVGTRYDSSHNYWFRISAYNESGESPYSSVVYQPTLPNRTDTLKPTCSLLINGDQMVTGSPAVRLSLTYNDPTQANYTSDTSDDASGVAYMRFSNDGSSWSSWLSIKAEYDWTLDPNGFGEKTVYCQVKDAAGNVSDTASDKINYYLVDTQPPKVSLKINGGAPVSQSQQVTLEIAAEDDLSSADMLQMCFSNDYSSWTSWEKYAPYKAWTLPSGDGSKKVYVRVKDTAGNVGMAYASIILQTANQGSPWENLNVFYSASGTQGTVTINGKNYNVYFVKASEVVLKLNAPGVTTVQYSLDGMRWLPPESVSPEKVISLPDWDGLKTVYVLLPNGSSYLCRFYLDKTPPELEASWLGGATVTNNGRATLVLNASDNASDVSALQVRVPGYYDSWQPFTQQLPLTFSGAGAKAVTVHVRDQAGNIASKTLSILN